MIDYDKLADDLIMAALADGLPQSKPRGADKSAGSVVKTATELIVILSGTTADSILFAALGIDSLNRRELKKWYRRSAREIHPDRCELPGAGAAFQRLNSLING